LRQKRSAPRRENPHFSDSFPAIPTRKTGFAPARCAFVVMKAQRAGTDGGRDFRARVSRWRAAVTFRNFPGLPIAGETEIL